MSKPAPGTYKIINRVLSVNNKQLAITANAEGNAATVTEESSSNTAQQVRIFSLVNHRGRPVLNGNSQWIIADFDSNTQSMALLRDLAFKLPGAPDS